MKRAVIAVAFLLGSLVGAMQFAPTANAACGGCLSGCFNCPKMRCFQPQQGCCWCCDFNDDFCNHQFGVSGCQSGMTSC
jgi:hypothetical protein